MVRRAVVLDSIGKVCGTKEDLSVSGTAAFQGPTRNLVNLAGVPACVTGVMTRRILAVPKRNRLGPQSARFRQRRLRGKIDDFQSCVLVHLVPDPALTGDCRCVPSRNCNSIARIGTRRSPSTI